MILDDLASAYRYIGLGDRFKAAFEFLALVNSDRVNFEKHEIAEKQLYALSQEYRTAPECVLPWEVHKRYADIHYIIEGSERVGWTGQEDILDPGEYNPINDCGVARNAIGSHFILLRQGQFASFFPGEYHKTKCMLTTPLDVKKIVMKIMVA